MKEKQLREEFLRFYVKLPYGENGEIEKLDGMNTELYELVKLNRTCGCSHGWCTDCLKWKGVVELVFTLITTRYKEERADWLKSEIEKLEKAMAKMKEEITQKESTSIDLWTQEGRVGYYFIDKSFTSIITRYKEELLELESKQ